MKHHAHFFNYFVSLVIAGLLCSCRAAYQRDTHTQEKANLSKSVNSLHTTTGTIASQAKTEKDEQGSGWKITYHFDTSQPINPITGLPPTSGIQIEGSQNTIKTKEEKNQSEQLSDSTSNESKTNQSTSNESATQSVMEAEGLTGIDDGLKTGLAIGIPIAFILLALIYYVRYHKTNTSK